MKDDRKDELEEENVYNKDGREESLDDDEISDREEAFMRGYDDAEYEEFDEADESESEEE